jgi:hypothetical protein
VFATRQAREMLETLNPEKAEPLFPTLALVRIVTLGNRWCDSIFCGGISLAHKCAHRSAYAESLGISPIFPEARRDTDAAAYLAPSTCWSGRGRPRRSSVRNRARDNGQGAAYRIGSNRANCARKRAGAFGMGRRRRSCKLPHPLRDACGCAPWPGFFRARGDRFSGAISI